MPLSRQLRLGDPSAFGAHRCLRSTVEGDIETPIGKFRFHLKAANGEIIAASQGYDTKASAEKGIQAVRKAAAEAGVVDLTEQEPAKK